MQLNGTIPAWIGSFSNLTELRLSDNQLTGSIPATFQSFQNMSSLYLHNNRLSGDFPLWLGQSLKLLYLFVLETSIRCLSACALNYVMFCRNLGFNYFQGTLPDFDSDLQAMCVKQLTLVRLLCLLSVLHAEMWRGTI
jgi:hypothetical protein